MKALRKSKFAKCVYKRCPQAKYQVSEVPSFILWQKYIFFVVFPNQPVLKYMSCILVTIKYTRSVLLTLLAALPPTPVVSEPSAGAVVLGGEVVVVFVVGL